MKDAGEQMKPRIRRESIPVGDPQRRQVLIIDLEEALGRPLTDIDEEPETVWSPSPQSAPLSVRSEDLTDRSHATTFMLDSAVHLAVDLPRGTGSGTGFMVTDDGLVATNAHMVGNSRSIEVLLGSDRGSVPARIIQVDEEIDLALLAIQVPEDVSIPPMPLGRSTGLEPLAELVVVGNAQVRRGEPPRAVVVNVARNNPRDTHCFETDGAIEPGFSGGPVFDPQQGAAVGVVRGGLGETVKTMIRIEHVRRMLVEQGYQFEEDE